MQKVFQTVISILGSTKFGSLCFQGCSSSSDIYGIKARSKEQCNRCISTKVVSFLSLRLSRILSKTQGTEQRKTGERNHGLDHSSLANTTMVPSNSRNMCGDSPLVWSTPKLIVNRQGNPHQVVENNSLLLLVQEVSGKICLCRKYQRGLTELITFARRKSTVFNYESDWRKWIGWCCQQQIDSYRYLVTYVLEVLAYLAEMKFEYTFFNINNQKFKQSPQKSLTC